MDNQSATLDFTLPRRSRHWLRLVIAASLAISSNQWLGAQPLLTSDSFPAASSEFLEQELNGPVPEEFVKRVDLALDCWVNWVAQAASLDAQKLADLKTVVAEKQDALRRKHWQRMRVIQPLRLPSDLPVRFQVGNSPVAQFCSPESVWPMLTDNQFQQLQEAARDRFQEHAAAIQDYALAILDSELFLSPAQWDALATNLPRYDLPFFFTQPLDSHYLQYLQVLPVSGIVTAPGREQLTARQLQRLELMSQTDANTIVDMKFHAVETGEVRRERIDARVRLLREKVFLRLAARADDLEREDAISKEQADRLRTVAKGLAVALCEDWRVTLLSRLDQWEHNLLKRADDPRLATLNMGITNLELESPERNPLWKSALPADDPSRTRIQNVETARRARFREARDRAVLSMLDRELWLLPAQRAALLPLLRETLPPPDMLTENRECQRDLLWLAHAFCLIDVDQLQQFFNPAQHAAWRQMQASFPIHRDPSIPVAIILLKDGARLHLRMFQKDGQEWATPSLTPSQRLSGRPPVAPMVLDENLLRRLNEFLDE